MTRNIVFGIAAAGASRPTLATAACSGAHPATTQHARVERGKYLVTVGGCNDCHTPLKMGAERARARHVPHALGAPGVVSDHRRHRTGVGQVDDGRRRDGTAFSGPWGVSFAANLTPDQNTGLGIWTEDMFMKTLRTGRHMGVSREILPPMPWFNYGEMTDEDLKAVYAFLRTIPPVHNRVRDAAAAGGAAGGAQRAMSR